MNFYSCVPLQNERRCLQVSPHYGDIFKRPDDLPLFVVLLCLLTEYCGTEKSDFQSFSLSSHLFINLVIT
jgi:hypothetical protein